MRSALLLALLASGARGDVRALTLKDEGQSLPTGGGGAVVFADAQALRKRLESDLRYKFDKVFVPLTAAEREAVAARMTQALAAQVDFSKERIVWVSWTTGGPPFGAIAHEIRDKAVVFFVRSPGPGVRGERALSGNDFFAVPAELTASFEPGERPAK